jgi:2'-5' RNA ligase
MVSTSATSARSARSATSPTAPGLRDHWQWRPDWASERPCLLWYLTFESQPALSRQAEQAQARLRGVRAVDLVPLPWLHLTLDDVGFADELAPRQVDGVVAAAAASVAGWEPPPVTLGPMAPMEDAVVLQAGPAAELARLRERLRMATTAVLGPGTVSGLEDFRPHVTLAYLNDACEPGLVMDPLTPVRQAQVVVAVPRLTLAAVTRRDRHYQWTCRAVLPLGPGDPADPR